MHRHHHHHQQQQQQQPYHYHHFTASAAFYGRAIVMSYHKHLIIVVNTRCYYGDATAELTMTRSGVAHSGNSRV